MATTVRGVDLVRGGKDRPLLVLGPSLGTSVAALWQDVLPGLSGTFDVIGWDLPGHGNAPALDAAADVSIPQFASEVATIARAAQAERGAEGEPFWYAGVSVAGAVGIQLLLEHADDVAGAVLLATGARIGDPQMWRDRADLVASAGTPTQVAGAAARWFAPGFIESHGDVATRLLGTLQVADRHSYAACCRAIAEYDVSDRLGEIAAPVLALAGSADAPTPVALLAALAAGVKRGRLEVLRDVAHQIPAEAPGRVSAAIVDFYRAATDPAGTRSARQSAGMQARRDVLGEEHVGRAIGGTSAFTADFQDLISRYAWGEIWTRPGLDRPMRSAVTLTALITGGHWEEFPMHVRAARRNGLTEAEIGEILLQCAIYCSVPSANRAFAIADEVLREMRDAETDAR